MFSDRVVYGSAFFIIMKKDKMNNNKESKRVKTI